MKIYNKKLFLTIFLLLLPIFFVLAQDYYSINPGQTITIDKHGVCRVVSNETGSLSTFIPVKASDEWLQFRTHYPNHINLLECFTVPSAPTNVSCSTVSDSSIYISWSSVSEADGYYIYRCEVPWYETSCTPTTLVSNRSVSYWTNSGLSVDTAYSYRVRAYNSAGTSNYSSIVTCKTDPEVDDSPPPPSGDGECDGSYADCSRRSSCDVCLTEPFDWDVCKTWTGSYYEYHLHCCYEPGATADYYCEFGPTSAPCCCCLDSL